MTKVLVHYVYFVIFEQSGFAWIDEKSVVIMRQYTNMCARTNKLYNDSIYVQYYVTLSKVVHALGEDKCV